MHPLFAGQKRLASKHKIVVITDFDLKNAVKNKIKNFMFALRNITIKSHSRHSQHSNTLS